MRFLSVLIVESGEPPCSNANWLLRYARSYKGTRMWRTSMLVAIQG